MNASFDEAPTARIYLTDVGPVDWEASSEAAQAIAIGKPRVEDFRRLGALFKAAFWHGPIPTDVGPFDGERAVRMLAGLRVRVSTEGLDELWSVLFALFEGARRG